MDHKCKKCNKSFIPTKGLVKFCSMSCRNSHSRSEDSKNLTSKSLKKFYESEEGINILNRKREVLSNRSDEEWYEINTIRRAKERKRILALDFDTLSFDIIKKRLKYEVNNTCERCNNSKWMDEDIALEIDHIDGNNTNNSRDNLRVLCPNCHSLTPTWRGRNKKTKRGLVTDKELYDSLIYHKWNMRQALLKVGMVAKGGNYIRCHRIRDEYISAFGKEKYEAEKYTKKEESDLTVIDRDLYTYNNIYINKVRRNNIKKYFNIDITSNILNMESLREIIYKLYIEEKKSFRAIGKLYNMDGGIVKSYAQILNIELRTINTE